MIILKNGNITRTGLTPQLKESLRENNAKLLKIYEKELGKHFLTRVAGTSKEMFSFKMFEKGLVLKRANRGFIVLDKFDVLLLKDMVNEFLTKTELQEAL